MAFITVSAAEPLAGGGQTWQFIRGLMLIAVFIAIVVWLGLRSLKRSEDPARLVFKWVISAFMLWVTVFKVGGMIMQNPFLGVPLTAACGLVFAIIWRENVIAFIAKPFESLYDGGDVEAEPQPFYSLALAQRKRGHYPEAIALIRAQLEKFPNDFQGQFMIAEILAENLNDLPGADLAIKRICNQKGHSPGSVAMALNTLADWQLKYAQDRNAAREALEKIIDLLPGSESSALASQRIGHLAGADHLLAAHDRRRIVVKPGVENIGLLPTGQQPRPPEVDPARQAAEYVEHLEAHPLDTEAREKLAVLYANHYQRLDLAADQIEQLIGSEGQPTSRVVHWLNLLADLQIEHGANYETARATLQRIVDRFPNAAASGIAQSRIAHLKLEFRKKEKSQTVALGSYEQDIGLKAKPDGES
jgi:tetratricopeptide (TPR) repeat protein